MARIRSIKPELPQSESLGRVSREARLLFVLLWTVLDDEGRTRGSSRMLASLLYPYDDDAKDKIEGWLTELEQETHVRRYIVDGQHYIDVPNWLKHQKIDHPSPSKLPAFSNTREPSRILAPDQEGIGKEGIGTTTPTPSGPGLPPPASPPVAPSRKRRGRVEILEAFSPEVRRVVNELAGCWRKEDPEDGRIIRISVPEFGKAVAVILKTHPETNGDELIKAGKDYCESERKRYKAPQFFYGPEGPWDGYVQTNLTRLVPA